VNGTAAVVGGRAAQGLIVSFRQACAIAIEDTAATQAADLAGISGNLLWAAIGGGAAGVSLSFWFQGIHFGGAAGAPPCVSAGRSDTGHEGRDASSRCRSARSS